MMDTIPIYPFKTFGDLNNKTIMDNFDTKKVIENDSLKKMIASSPNPEPRIMGINIEDRILSLFQDENYRFGPENFIEENKTYWHKKFRYFTSQGYPLQMVVMACPFKVPVPLKTARITADLGEALQIKRLKNIVQWIETIYKPGAIVTILAEGILGEAHGIPEIERQLYRESLPHLLDITDVGSEVRIHNLDDILSAIPKFRKLWQEQVDNLKALYQNKDPNYLRRYAITFRSIYHMVPTREYPIDILMDVYNENIPNEKMQLAAKRIRAEIESAAIKAVFLYHGFLDARDASHYLEIYLPGHIKLTVSPKPSNLGIIPINTKTQILPHHGVPIYDIATGEFSVEYLIDVRRSSSKYTPIHLKNDNEDQPFYYERRG